MINYNIATTKHGSCPTAPEGNWHPPPSHRHWNWAPTTASVIRLSSCTSLRSSQY